MIIKKYKIGNFTVEINSQTDFVSSEPYSSFSYDGEQTDYTVSIGFTADLPNKIESPDYDAQDRVCVYENGVSVCCYKSRDNGNEYYACRKNEGKNISILIDEKYHDMLREDVIFTLIGIEEMATECNGCVLHSSFIEKDGGAILFCGPCSIGKSTQANLWKEHADAVVINGDKTMIFEIDGAFYASGMPFSGSSKDCLNKVLPLKAVISLQQAACNSATKLDATEAFYKIYKNCYPVHHSRDLTGGLLDFVQKLGQSVPVFEFACLADESAVRYLERKLCPFMQSL
jgi:hypothetical protein